MSRPIAYIRILHWWNPEGERVNLAVYGYGDGFGPVWRTLEPWERAAAFVGWDAGSLKENVETMIADMAAWSPFQLHTQWRHEMSCLQLTQPTPTMVFDKTPEKIADDAASTFLYPGRKRD